MGRIRRLKIILYLSAILLIVLTGIAYLSISAHEKSIRNEALHAADIISNVVYHGIIYPMSVGDNKTVVRELADLKQSLRGGEIFIFGRNGTITFASQKEKVRTDVARQIRSADLAAVIQPLLQKGVIPERAYEERIDGKPYLTVLRPIFNESRCRRCHQAAGAVQGGLMVRQNIDTVYTNIANLHVKNFTSSLMACLAGLLLLLLVIDKLVLHWFKRVIHDARQHA